MGRVKIKNNIPISPDKWIYEYDINPIIYVSLIRSFIKNGLRSKLPISLELMKYRKWQEKRKYLQL